MMTALQVDGLVLFNLAIHRGASKPLGTAHDLWLTGLNTLLRRKPSANRISKAIEWRLKGGVGCDGSLLTVRLGLWL